MMASLQHVRDEFTTNAWISFDHQAILAILLLWQVCYLQSCLISPTLALRRLFPHLPTFRPSAAESQLKEGPRAAASISLNVDDADIGCVTSSQRVQSFCQTDLEPEDRISPYLHCQGLLKDRYAHLRSFASPKPRFYFALDLYQAANILPRLLASILEAIKFLGPTYCYVSVVEGSSDDGTSEMLYAMGKEAKELGFAYSLIRSNMDSKNNTNDRIEILSKLRNFALAPLLRDPSQFDSEETTIVFMNDISLCPNDVLELVHQRRIQGADMACPMDYSDDGLFYDVWVARSMTGDIFFEIPRSGLWKYAKNLLWDDPATKQRLDAHQPFQVFSCWNGMAAINMKPFVEKGIRFRRNREGECYMGEPTLLCKDFWANGFGRILVVPSVWVAYSHKASIAVKKSKGYVEDNVKDNKAESGIQEMVEWKSDPPSLIKCPIPSYANPQWVPPYEGFSNDYS